MKIINLGNLVPIMALIIGGALAGAIGDAVGVILGSTAAVVMIVASIVDRKQDAANRRPA